MYVMGFNLVVVNISAPGIVNNSNSDNIVYNDIAGHFGRTIITGGEIECIIS